MNNRLICVELDTGVEVNGADNPKFYFETIKEATEKCEFMVARGYRIIIYTTESE